MEKDVAERCRVNASNQDNPAEVETELQRVEEKIEANRVALLDRVNEFQVYLEKRIAEEKDEAKQLKAEQDELEAHEQQLLNPAKDDDDGDNDEENERTRQSLNDQLRNAALGQVSPTGSPMPTDPTNEQLKAELECVRSQRGADRQALDDVNELLAAEETVRHKETREKNRYRNATEKLAMQLKNYKVAMSTLQEEDETQELQNPSAHIAEDPNIQEFVVDEEGDENEDNGLVLGLRTVFYSV